MRCQTVLILTLRLVSASEEACDDKEEASLLQSKKSQAESQGTPCGVVQNNFNIAGGKINTSPLNMVFDSAACRQKCGSTYNCHAWAFDLDADQCWLYDQLNHFSCPQPKSRFQSGYCDPAEPPAWCTTTTTTQTTTAGGNIGDICGNCGSTGEYNGECNDGLVCTEPQNALLGGCPTCQKPPGQEVGEKCGTQSDGAYYGECQAGLLCAAPADAGLGAYNVCANVCGTFGGDPAGDQLSGGCNRMQSCSCRTETPCRPWYTVDDPNPEGCFLYCC